MKNMEEEEEEGEDIFTWLKTNINPRQLFRKSKTEPGCQKTLRSIMLANQTQTTRN